VTSANHDALNRLTSQQGGGALVFNGTVSEPGSVTIPGQAGHGRFKQPLPWVSTCAEWDDDGRHHGDGWQRESEHGDL